jgi:hypothetical protein
MNKALLMIDGDVKHIRFFVPLTSLRSWALLEKLPIVQPLKNFPVFYGTRRFIAVFTSSPYPESDRSSP